MKISVIEVISKFITQISAGTPASPSNGQFWYDSILNKFRGKTSTGSYDFLMKNPADNILANNIGLGYRSITLTSGNTQLTVNSEFVQNLTGWVNWPLKMPDVTTLTLGHQFRVINSHSANINIAAFNGVWIVQAPAGSSYIFTCISLTDNTPTGWRMSVETPGSSPGMTGYTFSVDFGSNFAPVVKTTITNALISPTSKIIAVLASIGSGRSQDELEFAGVEISCVPGTGNMLVTAKADSTTYGIYNFNYIIL